MCFNLETSIATFTSAMISGIAAIYLNQPILGILILCYGQMQFSELLIWQSIKDNDTNLNKIGTAYGKYLLPAHNIAIGLGIYLKTKQILPLIIGLIFYIAILIVYNQTCKNEVEVTKPGCGKDSNSNQNQSPQENKKEKENKCDKYAGKLQWPYNHSWYIISFIISIAFCYYYIKPWPVSLLVNSFFILTFITIFIIDKNNAYGSYWCWSTSALAPLIVFINYLLTNKYSSFIS